MEENTKVSPKKASRNLPSHYSSSLLYEVSSAEKLSGIKLAMCNPGQAENERHEQGSLHNGEFWFIVSRNISWHYNIYVEGS